MEPNRRDRILSLLAERGFVSVKEFCELLYVSEPTIRRELAILEKEELIRRSHGGAAPISQGLKLPLTFRQETMQAEKKRIARTAAQMVDDGNIIFIDTSTTAMNLIPELRSKKDITVVTNSLPALNMLQLNHISTKCTGGDLSHHSMGFVGYHAERYAASILVDVMFFSTPCISKEGIISDYSEPDTHLRQTVLENARKSVYLFDRSKFDKQAAFRVTDVNHVSCIISDMKLQDIWDCSANLLTAEC